MNYYIGADLGTSSLKILLVTPDGRIVKEVSRKYPVSFPHPGWSEQEPQAWWDAFVSAVRELSAEYGKDIKGIAAGGQMHGLVALDRADNVIRPAILWNDGRTAEETDYLNEVIGKARLSELTGNIAYAGFTAPKLLWMAKHEPDDFARIAKIMLPKDYLNYKLTGVHCTDPSDASGMLLFDVKRRRFSDEMLEVCGVDRNAVPKVFESAEAVGVLSGDAAAVLGLEPGIPVAAGAGDNAAAAVGTGAVVNGRCNISLGTSGTIFIATDEFTDSPGNELHSFCHADGGWHLMGCILSAASCNEWFCDRILGSGDYRTLEAAIPDELLGANDVFFLPYLMGERSPINDTDARGTFTGLRLDTTRAAMELAVLEGVAFAVRDNLEAARRQGVNITQSTLCGGGAKSPLWQRIIANVLNIDILIPETEQGPGYGAAMLAMTAAGEYPSVRAASEAICGVRKVIRPEPELARKYEDRYARYREIYPAMKALFKKLK